MPVSDSNAPWELYSKTMFNSSGFPLWHAYPELDDTYGPREVDLGSVGYIDRGRFRHLFSARQGADGPFNVGRVPPTFERFNPRNVRIPAPQPILHQPYVASRSVGTTVVQMKDDAASPSDLVSTSGSLSFECQQDTGALLILDQPGMGQQIPTKRHIVTYLRKHVEDWFEWVRDSLGQDIEMHQIKFVSGTIKTTKWACAAFSGSYRNKTGSLTVGAAGVGDLDINVSIANEFLPAWFHNNGPTVPTGGASSSTSLPPECNQCIFFHYYAAKKRVLHKVKTGAVPHELPSNNASDIAARGNSPVLAAAGLASMTDRSSSDVMDGGQFDPVAILLDYMLAKTDAEYAIASDMDVVEIFGLDGIPDDIAAGLEAINPPIEVDENDVATVAVDMPWLDQQTSAQAAVPRTEDFSGDLSGVEHVGDSRRSWRTRREQPAADPSEGEEGEDADNDDDVEAAPQNKEAVLEAAVYAHTGSVTSLAVSPDSRWVASGSDDTMIILWETERQLVAGTWESHGDIVWHLAFSPDSLRLASSGGEGRIMVWDVDTGEHLAVMEGHMDAVRTVIWSPDGSKLVSGSDDMTVRIWDGQTYELLHLLEGHNEMVMFVLFSHDGQYLVSGGAETNCCVWNVTAGALHKELNSYPGTVWRASFDPEDNRIVTASDDGSVRIWEVETGKELMTLHKDNGPVWVVAFAPDDGKYVLLGLSDSTLKIFDSFSGERVMAFEGHESMAHSVSFSPDGRFVASASSEGTVRLWRRSDGTNLNIFNEHNGTVSLAMFSPDGKTLSSASDDGTVRIRVLGDFVKLD